MWTEPIVVDTVAIVLGIIAGIVPIVAGIFFYRKHNYHAAEMLPAAYGLICAFIGAFIGIQYMWGVELYNVEWVLNKEQVASFSFILSAAATGALSINLILRYFRRRKGISLFGTQSSTRDSRRPTPVQRPHGITPRPPHPRYAQRPRPPQHNDHD